MRFLSLSYKTFACKDKQKQDKTKQNKTKQNKTKQNKTKQNKTKQNEQIPLTTASDFPSTRFQSPVQVYHLFTKQLSLSVTCYRGQSTVSTFEAHSKNYSLLAQY